MKKRYGIVTLILILCVGVIFSGCGPDYSSLSLSLNDVSKIELSITDEKVDYYLTINNYFDINAQFSFDFANKVAKVLDGSVQHQGNGIYKFSIAPITAGNTTLTITLKGLNKPLVVPVSVKKAVESITASTNQFVKKGESLKLNSSMFTFTPEGTTERNLDFALAEIEGVDYTANNVELDVQSGILSVGENCELNTITIVASSNYDKNIKSNIVIKVVQKIDISSLKLQIASQNLENASEFDEFSDLSLDETINLIISEKSSYQKKINVEYGLFEQGYSIEIKATNQINLGGENTKQVLLTQNSSFILSSNDVGEGKITLTIYQNDLPENYEIIELKVNSICKPRNITINGQSDIGLIELYTNSSQVKEYKFGISPAKANKEDYNYIISFYSNLNEQQIVEENKVDNLNDFVYLNYGGVPLTSNNLGSLNTTLTLQAKENSNDKYLAIKIDCIDAETTICSLVLYVKVYIGTTEFKIDEMYKNGTIYLPLKEVETAYSFYGLRCSEGATPGKLSISAERANVNICEIEQESTTNSNLIITPKFVGTQDFVITTANNLSVILKVIVFRELDSDDADAKNFVVQIADTANDNVSSFEPTDTNKMLQALTLKGKNSSVNLAGKTLTNYSDYNTISFNYTLELTTLGQEYFEIKNNRTITSLKFTPQEIPLTIVLKRNLVKFDNNNCLFQIEEQENRYTINLNCVNFIKELTMYASNNNSNEVFARNVSIYNKIDLSYINENLATVYLYMDLVQSADEEFTGLDISNFTFKSGAEVFNCTGDEVVKVGEIGYFYPKLTNLTKNESGYIYIGSFTYEYNNLRTLSSINIILKLTDNNTSKEFSSDVTLTIERYIDVESLWLSTPESMIYLDNTNTYSQKTISVQVLPANAKCQDLDVKIDTTTTNCIGVDIKNNIITFTYQKAGSGKILIFPISKLKNGTYRDNSGEYYYHLELDFVCADGESEQTALKLSNFEDLKNLNSEKHYYIDSTIDCGGKSINIPELNGSIRGTFLSELDQNFENAQQIGSIINFVVSNNNTGNIGLFRTINSGAKIYNLTISGTFDSNIMVSMSANIGLLCGTNNGEIRNVTISLSNKNIVEITKENAQNVNIYMGILTGVNNGAIEINKNSKDSTMFVNCSQNANLVAYFAEDVQAQAYVGGIAGQNTINGKINCTLSKDFLTIGLYGINANVYAQSNANYFAGIVAENQGLIIGLKVTGEIDGRINVKSSDNSEKTSSSNIVAGFVSLAKKGNIENCISRIFVRGTQIVSGFIGECEANVILQENKIQATDDGTRQGINASFIVGYGKDAKLYAFSNVEVTGISSETYFDRTLPASFMTQVEETSSGFSADLENKNSIKIIRGENNQKNIENKDITLSLTDTLSKDYYYGEIVKVVSNTDITFVDYQKEFVRGQEDDFNITSNLISDFILSAYLQIDNQSAFENLSDYINRLETKSLLEFTNLLQNDKVKDINIEILNLNTARLDSYGKYICLINIGELNFKVSSSLNYKKSVTLKTYITNYYDGIALYNDRGKTQSLTTINLVNKQTSTVYFDLYSSVYNYNNYPVSIKGNTEVTFDYNVSTTYVDVNIQGQVIFLTSNNISVYKEEITFKSKFIYNNQTYYKMKNKTVSNSANKEICAFVLDKDLNKLTDNTTENTSYIIEATTGIENIKLSKSVVEAEPSDNIETEVSYTTYNENDKIVTKLRVYNNIKENDYTEYALTGTELSGVFKDNSNNVLFTLYCETIENDNGKIKQKYSLKMPINEDFNPIVYNYLKNKRVELIFGSSNNLSQQASLVIEYTPETISSVLINNFNKESNSGMIQTEKGISTINVDKMLTSGKQSSTGELNLLNAYVYTKLSEFEYVDVTMTGFEGGYLGFVNYSYIEDKEIGKISNSTLYTTISNGVTMRIFKTSDISLESGNTLRLGIVYNIPKTVEDGTIVPITFTFYNSDNKEIYVESINLVTKTANQVSFDIVGKIEIEEINDTKTYNVARGLKYLLDTTIVGYNEDEVVFESSNPSYAYVSKEGNNYYLSITNASILYNQKDDNGNDIAYLPVTIRSYGQKQGSGTSIKGIVKTTILRIYEFIVDEDNLFGDTSTLSFRLFDWVNVKNLVADKIICENSSLANNAINNFKNDFKNNANFYIIDKDLNRYKLENGLILKLDAFEIDCSNNEYRVKSLKTGEICDFKLEVEYVLSYKNGMPVVANNISTNTPNIKSTTFDINTYISTTGDKPTPIFNYKDMQNMQDGEYYRQVADINIKADELKMLEVSPKLFDGNGYNINILSGTFNFNLDSSSDFALFKTLQEGCIIKNVSIVIVESLRLTLNNNASTAGANISLLVAENSGIITNCSVKSKSSGFVSVEILNTVSVMERSYFAGLCARNLGYISNCQIECNLTANGASLGGLVAENSGYISSCYIKNSRIYNTTTTTSENIVTGGFVCKNTGTIKMSYIEGAQSDTKIYSDYVTGNYTLNSKIIYTATKVAGFVYTNTGKISDCYSNIPIVSSNDSSGFVSNAESGEITRVFSLSKLKQQDTHSFGFVSNYNKDEVDKGMFKDCFFIIQKNIINFNTSESNYKTSGDEFESVISGITPLKIKDFNVTDNKGNLKTDNKFASFITDNEKINGVWFYAFDNMKNNSIAFDTNTYVCNVEGFEEYGEATKAFTARRLQLVSPNLISYSKQDLILDENGSVESGEFTYQMSKDSDIIGSKTNPYLIASAKEFIEYCKQNTNTGYEYFSLISDIDFIEEEIYYTNLYNNTLLGYFDGNGFEISGYSVNSTASSQSAGLFAELGRSGTGISCLKNLTLDPHYINLPNSVFVGGFAGSATNSSIYNINLVSKDVTIVGKNVVGGMFGRTYGQINMALINSNVNVKSTNYNALELSTMADVNSLVKAISYDEIGYNKTKVSYAGAIVGYAGGMAEFKGVTIGENTKVQGMIAGLLFGGIGPFAEVSQFKLELNSFDNKIVAYAFGGYVAGEAKGVIKDFELNSDIINSDLFSCYPIAPVALGGVVGYANGLELTNLSSTQGYAVIGAKTIGQDTEGYLNVYNPYIAKFVGGVIGYGEKLTIDSINIKNSNTNANIGLALMGGNCVGGIVGYVGGTLDENNNIDSEISNVNINLIGQKTYINADEQEVTDKLFISYVSEAVGEAIGFVPNEKQYFGLLYGFGISAGDSANELKLLKETQSNIVTISNELSVIFLGYKIDTRHEIDLGNNIHNFSSNTYNNKGTSINDKDENKIVFITKNLSTNTIVKSPKI